MEWVPVVKPHKIAHPRCSTHYPVQLLQTVTAPYIDAAVDCADLQPGVQLLANGADLIYVSSPTTLTVLHSALSANSHVAQTKLAMEVAFAPHVSNVQVFETKLSVFGLILGRGGRVYVHTLYHVFLLAKRDGDQYSIQLLYTAEDQILDVREGAHSETFPHKNCEGQDTAQHAPHAQHAPSSEGQVEVLTVAHLLSLARRGDDVSVEIDIDISDIWRITPVTRAQFARHGEGFVIVEPTAIHFVSHVVHIMVCSIPTQYLDYSDKFLNFVKLQSSLVVVTQSCVLVYSLLEENDLTLQRKVSHNVDLAHFCQFYPGVDLLTLANLEFSIFSIEKVSFFTLSSIPDSEYITFLIPYKTAKLRNIQTNVLDKANYLKLSVDKRSSITQRINCGLCGAMCSADRQQTDRHFFLTEHKDLFCSTGEEDMVLSASSWSTWLSHMTFDREYWVESVKVDLFYNKMRSAGSRLCKEQPMETEAVVKRDLLLEDVKDKYTRSLLDQWDWS